MTLRESVSGQFVKSQRWGRWLREGGGYVGPLEDRAAGDIFWSGVGFCVLKRSLKISKT